MIDSPSRPRRFSPATPLAGPTRGAALGAARWSCKTRPTDDDWQTGRACGIVPVVAAVLRTRGITGAENVRRFLDPGADLLRDPQLLPDIGPAVERLHVAIKERQPLLVFGDYDADGITSTALLVRALRRLGANLEFHIPERADGYGLSVLAVEQAAAAGMGLVLTADCGITAHAAAERARELGLDLIITDHHEPGAELPPALAVVNPKRADSQYGFRELCGCGVAYKLVLALLERHWPQHLDSVRERFSDLAGLAAIADCVPLVDENRYIAREGLRRLAQSNKLGLRALIQVAGVKVTGDSLTGRQVGFSLAPRLNAAGRIDAARKSLDLLMSGDEEECRALAEELEGLNKQRQDVTHHAFHEALELVHTEADLGADCAVIVAREGWQRGVVGLVASRLVERFARPAIALVVDNGTAHGSGRSIDGFDLHELLDVTREMLLSGGGHRAACGLSIETARIAEFRRRALDHAATRLQPCDLVHSVDADCLVTGLEITDELTRDLGKLEPCGTGNPEPLLMVQKARIVDGRPIGAGGEHLKWRVQADGRYFDAVWWRPGERANGLRLDHDIDLCFVPQFNTWNGRTSVQLVVKDVRVSVDA